MDEGADDVTTTIEWLDDWILTEFKPEMFEELLSDIEDMATNDGEWFTSSSSFFGGEPVTLSPSPPPPPPPPLPPQDSTCEKKKRALFRLEIPHSTYFPRRSMRLKDAIEKSGTPGKETAEVISKLVFPRRSVRLVKNRNVYFPRRRITLAFPKRVAKNRNFPRRSMRLAKNRNISRGGQYHPCGEGRRQPPA
nr:MAG: hypothetical protein [Sesarmops intermedium nimavirus]